MSETGHDRVVAAVDELSRDLVALTQAMVRIPTETHPPSGDEGPGQRHLVDYLTSSFGWEPDVFLPTDVPGIEKNPGWWPGLNYEDRPNVVVRRPGTGGGRSIILNGHIDVVAAGSRELWKHEPYGGEIDEGRIYGRGAVDMKGGIAAMIFAMRAIEHAGLRLRGDVIIESVVNEELGGYNGTLACCVRGYQADAAIVTEPTECQIKPAHKGGQGLRLHVPGRAAHANVWWRGVSALDKAIYLKGVMDAYQRERFALTRNNPYFSDPEEFPIPALVDTVWSLRAGTPEVMSTPDSAVLDFWIDALPGEDLTSIVDGLEARINAAADQDPFLEENRPRLERAAIMRPFHPTSVPLDHPIVTTLTKSCEEVIGRAPTVHGLSGVCDAMMFNLYSPTPAIVFGPGDLSQAHAPDEYIEVEQLVRAAKIMAHLLISWCGAE